MSSTMGNSLQPTKPGRKISFMQLIESQDGKGSYEDRLRHHAECRGGVPVLKKCNPEWFYL